MTLKTALRYDRYELKYHIPARLVPVLCRELEAFCDYDHFSKLSPDGHYQINNLYLDTPSYLFYRRSREGVEGRFNMRVRRYGAPQEKGPVYLEVKTKSGNFVKKIRAKVDPAEWFPALERFTLPSAVSGVAQDNAARFAELVIGHRAAPVVCTSYRRLALFSTVDEYARITFDRELRFGERRAYDFTPESMRHYDHAHYFDPGADVILELKCEARVPWWILDLLRRHNLERRSFSKFSSSLRELGQEALASPHTYAAGV